jgi:hypothetical protein
LNVSNPRVTSSSTLAAICSDTGADILVVRLLAWRLWHVLKITGAVPPAFESVDTGWQCVLSRRSGLAEDAEGSAGVAGWPAPRVGDPIRVRMSGVEIQGVITDASASLVHVTVEGYAT